MGNSAVTYLTFQPAGSNVIMITWGSGWGYPARVTNGTLTAIMSLPFANTGFKATKMFINNTNYLTIVPDTDGQFYCGVQVA